MVFGIGGQREADTGLRVGPDQVPEPEHDIDPAAGFSSPPGPGLAYAARSSVDGWNSASGSSRSAVRPSSCA